MRRRVLAVEAVVALALVPAACAHSSAGGASGGSASTSASAVAYDPALHDELLAMSARDQAGRTGGEDTEGDATRTARLKQIIDEHGWPGFDLVGRDGGDAAWLVAQHSDTDLPFQKTALELLTAAADAGQASPGNVAYLDDRVAVAENRPQTYGTQIGCAPDGTPVPRTPIADDAAVDTRRAAAGLPPLADYLAEMTTACAADG